MNSSFRMAGVMAVLLVLSGASSATSPEDSNKGSFLYQACQAALIDHPDEEQTRLGDTCLSYIEGFIDGEGPAIKYKFFMGVSNRELASAYVHYVREHKDYLNMSKGLGLEAALKVTYWRSPK